MTPDRDPNEPLDPLPLGQAATDRIAPRRLDRRVLLAAATALGLVVGSALFFGGEEAPPEAAEDTDLPAEPSAVEPSPETTDEPLRPDPPEAQGNGFSLFATIDADAFVEPMAPLTDGQTVTVYAEDPFLFVEEAGYALCRIGISDACTNLDGGGFEFGDPNSMSVSLPRRFTDWRGDQHDCVLDGPCEVRLWALDSTIVELNVPIDFDAAAAPRAVLDVDIEAEAVGLRTHVKLELPTTAGFSVLACTTQATSACATDPLVTTFGPLVGAEVSFSVDRLLFTPRGPHDCVEDGPCELRFVTDDGRLIAPVPISFDPAAELPRPRLDVRPSTGLRDGDTVELRTSDVDAAIVVYSLCAPERFLCTRFDTADVGEALIRRVPRFIEPRTGGDDALIDCAIEPCVIRVAGAGTAADQAVTFDPDLPPRPAPEIALGGPDRSYRPGDGVELAVRGLLVADPDPDARTPVSVRFCEAPTTTASRCVSAISDGDGIGADGRFEATITVPNFDRQRSRVVEDGERQPFCDDSCWLVVTTRLATPGASIPIDIELTADADD